MKKMLYVWLIAFVLCFFAVNAMAQAVVPPVANDPVAAVSSLAGMLSIAFIGTAGIVALLVNVLKQANVIQDGQSQNWTVGLSLLGLLILWVLKTFAPSINLGAWDSEAQAISGQAVVFIPFIVAGVAWVAQWIHSHWRGFPVLGYSFTVQQALPSNVKGPQPK